jgi:hypothetical protein
MRAGLRGARNVVLACSLFAFVLACGGHFYFGVKMPRIPDPEAGRVYPLISRSVSVYLTRGERGLLLALFVAAIGGALIALAIHVAIEGLRRSNKQ